jgi:glucose-6-phosphate isomerase
MITFNNSFFFSQKGFDFLNDKNYKKNLSLALKKSDLLLQEFTDGKNEVLQSFTKSYQNKIRNFNLELDIKNKKKIVVGLGGSSSGGKALSFYMKDKVVYFDNLDYDYLKNFFLKENIKDYFFFIISKSGDTFETLAILNLLLLESKKKSEYNIFESMLIITEKRESILSIFAKKNNIKLLEHNPNIGGRFSILSETGMLPFLDKNILTEEASEKYIKLLNNLDDELSPAKNASIILTCMENKKIHIYCNLIYNYRLKHFSYWFHQLHAESLGKNGKGMTPITSICPKDHHSMMQLYLDGPRDKFFNIFSPPDESFYESFSKEDFYNIENNTPAGLLKKQFNSVIEVFNEKQIPNRVINISNHRDPLNLIELFAYFLIETILLGYMMDINPYDQPSVQHIKNKIFKG